MCIKRGFLAGALIALLGCQADPVDNGYRPPDMLDDDIAVGRLTQVNMDPTAVQSLIRQLQDPAGDLTEMHSLLVYKDGLLVVEEYFTGNDDIIRFRQGVTREHRPPVQWHRERKHYVASVNKALTATLAGIAFAEADISLNEPVMSLLPELRERFDDPHKQALTLQHLLTMQLGFEWDEWTDQDLALLWQSDDFAAFLLSRPNIGPGKQWVYNSAGPNLLLRALENLVGEPVADWADRHFYRPLGIADYHWEQQPDGYPEGSARMLMRPRDMLKVGITYLDGGQWQGRQIIPRAWVDATFQPQVTSEHGAYSYYFWLRQLGDVAYLSADGDGGQYINIFPEQNMVIVMTQGNYLQWPLYKEQAETVMQRLFSSFIEPH